VLQGIISSLARLRLGCDGVYDLTILVHEARNTIIINEHVFLHGTQITESGENGIISTYNCRVMDICIISTYNGIIST
jgi:hypothetical protein